METLSNKFILVTEKINDLIIINTLFLITNSILFQCIFFIDFKLIFLPLFFFSSLTLLPSLVALTRTLSMKTEGKTTKVLRTYLKELKVAIKANIKLCIGVTTVFFTSLANLYLLDGKHAVTQLLFLLNLVVLICVLIFALGLVIVSPNNENKFLLRSTISFLVESIIKVILCAVFIGLGLYMTFGLYYPLIIIVFGLLIKIIAFFGKGNKINGIPNEPKYNI